VSLEWTGIDPLLLRPWLPAGMELEGRLAGRIAGSLLPGRRLDLQGNSALSAGTARLRRPGGVLNATVQNLAVSWVWHGETLRGTLEMALAERGQARGSFELPLPARLPLAVDPKGAVRAALAGQLQEQGLLTALFPALIQESHGELTADLRASGSWAEPRFAGELRLAKAGAYLPTAGIHVRDVQLTAQLTKNLVQIDSFRATSGTGTLNGTAEVQLQGEHVTGYRGTLNGERFQAVYLPELQLLGTPHLTFQGTPEKLTVRGDLRIPELLVLGTTSRAPVAPSKDVVLVGAPTAAAKQLPFELDVQVRVELGDRVLVRTAGIDAQLGGGIDLALQHLDAIRSKGEIRVVKGHYKTYGVDLEIVRGRLFYAGGPINRPTLDILALRTVGDVRAGVTVAGTPRAPQVKLYSEPAMSEVDKLAYIVLGHPLGESSEQAGLMAQAAGVLLSTGQSVLLQDQIKQRLGLSTLEIQQAGTSAGLMGYKTIPVTPPGMAPTPAATGISQSMLTVGIYLTPELYVSYGRSLFTGNNLVRLRYDFFKHWQVETQAGAESGADLYYKIDFK
jgi:translocation and assembly module TamB